MSWTLNQTSMGSYCPFGIFVTLGKLLNLSACLINQLLFIGSERDIPSGEAAPFRCGQFLRREVIPNLQRAVLSMESGMNLCSEGGSEQSTTALPLSIILLILYLQKLNISPQN